MTDDMDVMTKLVVDHGGPFPIETTHARVLAVQDAVAASAIDGVVGGRVETELMVLARRIARQSEFQVDPDLQLALSVDTSGRLALLHAATEDGATFVNEWHVLSACPVIPEDGWVRVTLAQDYAAKMYQVRLDGGDPIADAQGLVPARRRHATGHVVPHGEQ